MFVCSTAKAHSNSEFKQWWVPESENVKPCLPIMVDQLSDITFLHISFASPKENKLTICHKLKSKLTCSLLFNCYPLEYGRSSNRAAGSSFLAPRLYRSTQESLSQMTLTRIASASGRNYVHGASPEFYEAITKELTAVIKHPLCCTSMSPMSLVLMNHRPFQGIIYFFLISIN